METEFWCSIFILSICTRRSFTFDQPKLIEQVISTNNNTRIITTEATALATTDQSHRWHEREGYVSADARMMQDDTNENDDMVERSDDIGDIKAMSQPKNDYWGGYYDFLINEGSYKFWAIFQLSTAALLIYSGFAALYYAKVNPQITEDYDDFLLKRRRRFVNRAEQPRDRPFLGFEPQSFQRILDAVAREIR